MLDLAALQQALTQDDIPGLVKAATYCSSSSVAPDPASIGVLSVQLPTGSAHRTVLAASALRAVS